MPRRNSRSPEPPQRPLFGGAQSRVEWRGETWVVRRITGAAAVKVYRCPGCQQEIRAGTPHVVAWPGAHPDAAERRHWHTSCWAARDRRAAR